MLTVLVGVGTLVVKGSIFVGKCVLWGGKAFSVVNSGLEAKKLAEKPAEERKTADIVKGVANVAFTAAQGALLVVPFCELSDGITLVTTIISQSANVTKVTTRALESNEDNPDGTGRILSAVTAAVASTAAATLHPHLEHLQNPCEAWVCAHQNLFRSGAEITQAVDALNAMKRDIDRRKARAQAQQNRDQQTTTSSVAQDNTTLNPIPLAVSPLQPSSDIEEPQPTNNAFEKEDQLFDHYARNWESTDVIPESVGEILVNIPRCRLSGKPIRHLMESVSPTGWYCEAKMLQESLTTLPEGWPTEFQRASPEKQEQLINSQLKRWASLWLS